MFLNSFLGQIFLTKKLVMKWRKIQVTTMRHEIITAAIGNHQIINSFGCEIDFK